MTIQRSYLAGALLLASTAASSPTKRLDNGLTLTPPLGWNSYNHYNCYPNQSIIESNAKALVDFGLKDLGYNYVTTDCGWTLPNRTANGTLTWNATEFPDGFPALGNFIHSLGLLFGVYSDAGVQMCNPTPQAGSLYHEQTDADTFAAWGADLLKYDNCFSSANLGYPDVDYNPIVTPAPRFTSMRDAVAATGRKILYQVCEWGIDFPSAWAPQTGNTWRITNDIIPAWRTIWRQVNQFVPSAGFAGPGQWPDLDMLEVGNDIFTVPEEQTHFSLWAIAKSPLVIGGALNDTVTTMRPESLAILKNKATVAFNQDSLGKAANLTKRYSPAGFDVWSGPLSGGRTVAALVNWNNETVQGTFYLPDAGLQSAGSLKDVWNNKTVQNVVTSYSATIAPHGTLLMELANTQPAGTYTVDQCGRKHESGVTFSDVYGLTDSSEYTLTVNLAGKAHRGGSITVSSSASHKAMTLDIRAGSSVAKGTVALSAGAKNTVILSTHNNVEVRSVQIASPVGNFYPGTAFTVSGAASHYNCTPGLCAPVGAKITNVSSNGTASITIPSSGSAGKARYVELTYINNDIALSTSWGVGSNSRNITVQVNGGEVARIDVPLSGKSSELFSPMKGWGDPATLGVLVEGFGKVGGDVITVGNVGGDVGTQPYGADFVGLRVV